MTSDERPDQKKEKLRNAQKAENNLEPNLACFASRTLRKEVDLDDAGAGGLGFAPDLGGVLAGGERGNQG